MHYDLNPKGEKTVRIGKGVYYLGVITEELKARIGTINDSMLRKQWQTLIGEQLRAYNDDYKTEDVNITENEIVGFISKVQGL